MRVTEFESLIICIVPGLLLMYLIIKNQKVRSKPASGATKPLKEVSEVPDGSYYVVHIEQNLGIVSISSAARTAKEQERFFLKEDAIPHDDSGKPILEFIKKDGKFRAV